MAQSAVRPHLSLVPPQGKSKKLLKNAAGPPPETKADKLSLINCFDEARLDLESYLDAIYRIGFSGHYIEMNSETILVIAQKAENTLKAMDKIFDQLTDQEGGQDNGQ